MKNFFLSLIAALTISPVLAPVTAEAHGALNDAMGDMYTSMKVITNALIKGQPTSDADLKAASNDLLASTVKASKILPLELVDREGKPLGSKAAEIKQYNEMMTQLLAVLTELDQEIKAGKKDAAKALLQNKVAPLQKKGHELFKKEH